MTHYTHKKISNGVGKKIKSIFLSLVTVIIAVAIIFGIVKAGNLEPPGSPAATMYTLSDIYTRLTTNATSTEGDHLFSPSASPASSMYTLTQIYNAIPTIVANTVKLGTSYLGVSGTLVPSGGNATTTDVCSGKTYFGANQTDWNLATGALTIDASKILSTAAYCGITGNIPTQTLSNTTTTVAAGYYNATTLDAVDTDLTAGNIKSGIDLFGVTGTFKSLLPDTGQTGCWGATGTAIDCGTAPVGQDAEYTASNSGTLNPSFTDNGNETITDNNTNLMWQKCSQGLSGADCATGAVVTNYWADALSYCEGLNFAGQTDWRLPNIKELQSIVNYQNINPAINTTYFPATQSDYYWSGTTSENYPVYAWGVYFVSGGVNCNDKDTNLLYVRCVRQ